MFKRVNKQKLKRDRKLEEQEEESYLGINEIDSDDSESSTSGSESGDDGSEGHEQLPEGVITVKEALKDPIYSSELNEDIKSCYTCPRVLLKNEKMVSDHLAANVGQSVMFMCFSVLMLPVDP